MTPAASRRSCPQAASISAPLRRRTCTFTPAASSTATKSADGPAARLLPGHAGNGVVGDHVEQRGPPPSRAASRRGVLGRVVDTSEQDVFEGQPPAGGLPVAIGGGHHRRQADRLVDRHQPGPQVVVGRVQRHGQVVAGGEVGQPVDRRRQPDGRDRDPPLGDSQAVGSRATSRAGSSRSRFASGSPIPITTTWLSRSSAGSSGRQPQQLLDDLTGGEVADHAVDAAGAEHAAHRTAHLRADADRPPRAVPQQDAFDPLAVGQLQEQLFGAVGGLLDGRRSPWSRFETRPRAAPADPGAGRSSSANDSARRACSQRRIAPTRQAGWPTAARKAPRSAAGSRMWGSSLGPARAGANSIMGSGSGGAWRQDAQGRA